MWVSLLNINYLLEMKSKQKLSARNHEPSPHKKPEETRVMNKSNGVVKAYSANTFEGLVRNYNEDRVSIILNISKPENETNWPKCSYFGVFDGHGGSLCSDFLRDNLHKFIIQDKNFPFRPVEALRNGFFKAQSQFLRLAESCCPVDKSGSCAITVLIVDDKCYVANVGDSRAILSRNKGLRISALSVDHKPNNPGERQRIEKHGGSVYQSNIVTKKGDMIPGPFRIIPGRLSVSRAIGDIQAKSEKYLGNPDVLIGDPEIKQFHFDQSHDFILLGCDGIFDKLTNEEVVDLAWKSKRQAGSQSSFLKEAVSSIIQESMNKKSLDNLTVVLILIQCHDPVPKKSSSTTCINPSSTLKCEAFNQEKLKTCTKEEIIRLSKMEKRRKPSMDLNKENTNTNNLGYLSNIPISHFTMKNNPFAKQQKQRERTDKEKEKVEVHRQKVQKEIPKLRKRQSQSRKVQYPKCEQTRKNIGDLMRY